MRVTPESSREGVDGLTETRARNGADGAGAGAWPTRARPIGPWRRSWRLARRGEKQREGAQREAPRASRPWRSPQNRQRSPPARAQHGWLALKGGSARCLAPASSTARPSPKACAARSPPASPTLEARARIDAGPRRRAGRRGPGKPGLRAQQGEGDAARPACCRSSTSCRPTRREAALLALIAELNGRADVHGILVQLPLPKQIDGRKVIEAIDPAKDVDGFHPVNVGRLAPARRALAPCTPRAA